MSKRTGKIRAGRHRLLTVAGASLMVLLVLLPGTLAAASVSSEVDPSQVEVGETVRYSVQATSDTREQVRVERKPRFGDAFQLVGRTRSPRVVVRNGNARRTLNLAYRLRALEKGTHEIEPPVIQIGDATHRPSPQTVDVTEGAAGRGDRNRRDRGDDSDREIFVDYTLEPDAEPYFGEQLTLRYSLFRSRRATNLRPRPPKAPSLDAFWIEDLSRDHEGESETVRVDGRLMKRTTLRVYALFPLETGSITVEPMTLEVKEGGFFGRRRSAQLESDPVELEVQPLPDGAPEGFYEGNVGDWRFDVDARSTSSRVGDTVSVEMRASGRGNPERLELPSFDDVDDFRVLDRSAEVESDVRGLEVHGTKTVTVDLMPTTEGRLEIPALEFVYFDPDTESYESVESNRVRIEVAPGELPDSDGASGDQTSESAGDGGESSSTGLLDELGDPISKPTSFGPSLRSPTQSPSFWFAAAIPAVGIVLLIAGPAVARRWSAWRSSDDPDSAAARARQRLAEADPGDSDAAARTIEDALKTYLADARSVPPNQLGTAGLDEALEDQGVSTELRAELRRLLAWCEETRYAPGESTGGASVDSALESARRLLERLEESASGAPGASESGAAAVAAIVAFAASVAAPGTVDAETVDDAEFNDALEAHQSEQWNRASEAWSRLAEQHPRRVDILTNLGLAAARSGDLGRARLALERARLLTPDVSRIRNDLRVVEKLVALEQRNDTARPPAPADVGLGVWRLTTSYPTAWAAIGFVVGLWLLFLGLAARRASTSNRLRSVGTALAVLGGAVLVVAAAAWAGSTVVRESHQPVVVVEQQPSLRSGPTEHASTHPTAGSPVAGTVLDRVQRRDEWTEVRLPGDRTAWVRSSALRSVSAQ